MSASNTTSKVPESTSDPAPSTTPPPPPSSSSTTPPPPPPTTTPTTRASSSTPPPPPTTQTTPTTTRPSDTSTPPPAPPSSSIVTQTTVVTPPGGGQASTIITTETQTFPSTPQSTSSGTTGLPGGSPNNNPNGSGSSLDSNAKTIAVATVVPIVVVALLVLGGLFFWRKRKQRKAAEEERRKEVEEYGFNPNADAPTAPEMGAAGGYEDASSGYRGWGSTTFAGSTGRKASTTMSGGAPPVAYSDGTAASPTQANVSDARSADPLMHGHGDGSVSPEGEILGAMGPSASANRGGDVRRGPSNASSSYSAAARSDGSGDAVGMTYGGDARYYDGYGSGPYSDAYGASPPRAGDHGGASSPIIRDNPARRNTRIENSGHYPQQAGISQNF